MIMNSLKEDSGIWKNIFSHLKSKILIEDLEIALDQDKIIILCVILYFI